MGETVEPIPMSLARRARLFATGAGPIAGWVAAAIVAAALAEREGRTYTVRGMAEERRAIVASTVAGRLLSVNVEPLDRVAKGDVLAVVDDAALRAEMDVVRAEAALLSARVAAERARLESEAARHRLDESRESRRLAVDLEGARLAVLDRRVDIETARVELHRLRHEEARMARLTDIGVLEEAERDALRFQGDAIDKFLAESGPALEEAQRQVDVARARAEEGAHAIPVELVDAERETAIVALEREGDEISARLRALEALLPDLVLRSPLDGVVALAPAMNGIGVVAGAPVVEVATVRTNVVVAWMPEDAPVRPVSGDAVDVIPEGRGGTPIVGRVEDVAEGVLMLPPKILRDVRRPEYGMPVRVVLDDAHVPAGRSVAVRFKR